MQHELDMAHPRPSLHALNSVLQQVARWLTAVTALPLQSSHGTAPSG